MLSSLPTVRLFRTHHLAPHNFSSTAIVHAARIIPQIMMLELRVLTYLNNTGVSLLQQKCYRQAMKTLGDAIAVAKGVTTGLSLSSDNDLSTSMKEVVQAAAQRLAMPQPLHLEEEITLDVLSDYDAYPAVGLPRGPNLSASVIRMESLEFEAPTTNDLAVSVSILFYNYGIAYRCLSAAIADQPAQSADCTQGALKMFRIAHATMSTFRVDPRETSQFRRMLLVSLLALHHLVEVSQHLGLECNDFSTRLENIQSEVARIVAMEKSLQVHAARAA